MASGRPYEVLLAREAEKVLRRLPKNLLTRIDEKIGSLVTEPRPPGCVKLTGTDLYRLRVGDWRIIYAVEDERLIVLIVDVTPRGDAYRNLRDE